MGTFSLSHWLIVLVVILILFGAGRIPAAMGDLARGIRAFRTGMRDDNAAQAGSEKLVEAQSATSSAAEKPARSNERPRERAATLGTPAGRAGALEMTHVDV
jgi:sec-independent protein translocase protein TatA